MCTGPTWASPIPVAPAEIWPTPATGHWNVPISTGVTDVTIVPRGAFTTGKQLTADFDEGVLYWCDREGMQVLSCNLDGSDLRALVVTAVG